MTPGAIQWLAPYWFALPPLLAVAVMWLRNHGRRAEPAHFLSVQTETAHVLHPWRRLLQGSARRDTHTPVRILLRSVVIGLLAAALAQPVRVGDQLPDPPQEREIIFIVGTSVSMILRDYVLEGQRIDRMSLLKGMLERFVPELETNRLSVILFGDSAYTYVPLTPDVQLVRRMLSRIQATMAGRFNALGDAIALAVKDAQATPSRQRILVVFADTHRDTGIVAPESAAALAAEMKIPVYTVAIGASNYAAGEKGDIGLIYDPVNLELMQEIADITGGRMYRAEDSEALKQAIYAIGLHERDKREVKPRHYREPLYHWPLLAGLILLTLMQIVQLTARPRMPT